MKQPAYLFAVAAAVALFAAPALAANNGNHGNSGSHGNAGGNGNGNAFGQSVQEADIGSDDASTPGNAHHSNVVALAGAGNAAHASLQALLHANSHSAVGRVRAYADANLAAQQADAAVTAALGTCNTALSTAGATGDCSTIDPADVPADAQQAYDDYLAAVSTAKTADETAQTALLSVTKNGDDPAVKDYIDGLLAKYYDYKASNP